MTNSGFNPADVLLEPGDSIYFRNEARLNCQLECLAGSPFCWKLKPLNGVGSDFRIGSQSLALTGAAASSRATARSVNFGTRP